MSTSRDGSQLKGFKAASPIDEQMVA